MVAIAATVTCPVSVLAPRSATLPGVLKQRVGGTDNREDAERGPMADGRFDFSLHNSPDTWFSAAGDSGQSTVSGANRRSRTPVPVTGRHADPLVSLLAGLAMAMVVGLCWYLLEIDGSLTSPWVVAGTGLLIGAAVRLVGGPFDPALRGTISLLLFLVTTLVVSFLIVRYQLARMDPDLPFRFEERMFVRNRILDRDHLLATGAGACLAIQLNYLWSRGR
jgi:hypothetical protein